MNGYNKIWIAASLAFFCGNAASAAECRNAPPKQNCTITIDAMRMLVPQAVRKPSGATVTIEVINRNPLDKVKFKLDRAPAAPPENPISTLLTLLSGQGIAGAIPALLAKPAPPVRTAEKAPAPPPPPPTGVEADLQYLRNRVVSRSAALTDLAKSYDEFGAAISGVYGDPSCQGMDSQPPDVKACQHKAKEVAQNIRGVTGKGIPNYEDDSKLLKKIDLEIENERAGGADPSTFIAERNEVAAAIEGNQFVIDKLKEARKGLDDAANTFESVPDKLKPANYIVPADRNTDTTVHVVLTHLGEDMQTDVVVHFQNWEWATLSAGLAFTHFHRDNYAIGSHFNAAETDPAKQNYSAIGRSTDRWQVIPISFVNFQLPEYTWRVHGVDIGPTVSVGAGVNIGTQSAEFAAGPGVHIGRVQLTLGAHWARTGVLENGYTEGQKVDPQLSLPVSKPYERHWSLAVTYRVR